MRNRRRHPRRAFGALGGAPPGLRAVFAAAILFTPTFVPWLSGAAHAQIAAEDVKAAFAYQFTKFIEWPPVDSDANAPFVVGVSAPPEVFESFAKILAGRMVDERKVQVITYSPSRSARPYDILFIAGPLTDGSLEDPALSRALTIGDAEGFLDNGGMIEFVQQGNRIRFKINATLARSRGFTMSSKLLSLATEVR